MTRTALAALSCCSGYVDMYSTVPGTLDSEALLPRRCLVSAAPPSPPPTAAGLGQDAVHVLDLETKDADDPKEFFGCQPVARHVSPQGWPPGNEQTIFKAGMPRLLPACLLV